MYNQDTTEQGMTAIALSTVITTQINSHVNLITGQYGAQFVHKIDL